LAEEKAYHYNVKWPTSFACPTHFQPGVTCPVPPYNNTWDSLAFRPRPTWFDDAKFGIFLHWGVFSVPSFMTEWYWNELMSGNPPFVEFHNRVYGCSGVQPDKFPCVGPPFRYEDFPNMFKAELFDPDFWANLFYKSGAKYVVLTSKHHEGWCNFPSAQHWNWNSVDMGPHRDLVADLTTSVRKAGLRMGLYHSLREWFNPLYVQDINDNCNTTSFVDEILLPTLKDMTSRYQPEVIWSDGAGDSPCTSDSVKYWKAPDYLSWLYNSSPVRGSIVTNDRWGDGSGGDYTSGPDRYTPGKLVIAKWESCFTIQRNSWGYDRTEQIADYINTVDLIYQLVSVVSCNGNLLLNVGPTADGRIMPAFEERLIEIGEWLGVNGEAIYGSVPWTKQNDTDDQRIWYTMAKPVPASTSTTVYAVFFDWPYSNLELTLTQVMDAPQSVSLLGWQTALSTSSSDNGLVVNLPYQATGVLPPFAWTLKLVWKIKLEPLLLFSSFEGK